jgi:4-hydroxy-tetrahydrodipicolinate synthase
VKDLIPRGSMTALVTPFKRDGLDEQAFGDFVEWQIRQGTDGLVPCSVAGEGSTLSERERDRLVHIAVEAASTRRPVIAATGCHCTERTIARTREAQRAGADAVLVVTPYYNRPSQEGLFQHFAAIASAVDIPILLQDAPDRTGISLTAETLARLRRFSSILGVVEPDESGGAALQQFPDRPGFARLSGRDELAVQHHAAGRQGCVSTIANLLPGVSAAIQEACRQRDLSLASALHRQLLPLLAVLRSEPEPVAIKYAVSCLRPGFNPAPRLPLAPPAATSRRAIEAALAHLADTPEAFAAMILHDETLTAERPRLH